MDSSNLEAIEGFSLRVDRGTAMPFSAALLHIAIQGSITLGWL